MIIRSWDCYVPGQHCCLQVCSGPALLCYRRWSWKWTPLSRCSSRLLWCSHTSPQGILCLILLAATFFSSAIHHFLSIQCRNSVDKERPLRTWISSSYASMRLWIKGIYFPRPNSLKILGLTSQLGIRFRLLCRKSPLFIHALHFGALQDNTWNRSQCDSRKGSNPQHGWSGPFGWAGDALIYLYALFASAISNI